MDRLSAWIRLIVSLPVSHEVFNTCITVWMGFTHPGLSHLRSWYAVACYVRHFLWTNNPGFFQAREEGKTLPQGISSHPKIHVKNGGQLTDIKFSQLFATELMAICWPAFCQHWVQSPVCTSASWKSVSILLKHDPFSSSRQGIHLSWSERL